MEETKTTPHSCRTGTGNLASLAPYEEFEKLLECPVCQDLPFPPIYTCRTGHIICNTCKVQLQKCPICKAPFTTSRSFLLESIVETSMYYCSHRDKGCNVTGNSQVIKDHSENKCTLRPAKCFLAGLDGCKGKLIFLPEYLTHLRDAHKLKTLPCTTAKQNAFKYKVRFFNSDVCWREQYVYWLSGLFNFDGNAFVTRSFRRGSKFFFQVAVITDTETMDDPKYIVKVSIESDNSQQYPKYQLVSVVPSIRDFHNNGQSVGVGEYGAVNRELLEAIGQQVVEESQFMLSFNVHYELTKIDNPAVNVTEVEGLNESLVSTGSDST